MLLTRMGFHACLLHLSDFLSACNNIISYIYIYMIHMCLDRQRLIRNAPRSTDDGSKVGSCHFISVQDCASESTKEDVVHQFLGGQLLPRTEHIAEASFLPAFEAKFA